MPRRPARKAPKGMPKEMAKALGLKGRAHPSKAPVRERTHNPLQYLLERASQGRGVTLPPNETLVVAQALMGSREELKKTIVKLSALQAQQDEIIARLEEDDIQAIKSLLLFDDDMEDDEEDV